MRIQWLYIPPGSFLVPNGGVAAPIPNTHFGCRGTKKTPKAPKITRGERYGAQTFVLLMNQALVTVPLHDTIEYACFRVPSTLDVLQALSFCHTLPPGVSCKPAVIPHR